MADRFQETGASGSIGPGALLAGRYRLDELVGRGGMATVYRAWDTLLERTVAVKALHEPYLSDSEFLERFRREARAAARLTDARVVSIYDYVDAPTGPLIVMEYVAGPTLKDELARRGRFAPAEAAAVGVQVCAALAAAHAADIVHRDVKSRNILVERDRPILIKVADFGIAKTLEAGDRTQGITLGSVHYLSPEQAGAGVITPATDIYSLGVVLFEMLTGQVPFTGTNALDVIRKHAEARPPALTTIDPTIPVQLAAIVDRALQKEPSARFPSAEAMGAALAHLLDGSHGSALPASGIPLATTARESGLVSPAGKIAGGVDASANRFAGFAETIAYESAAGATPSETLAARAARPVQRRQHDRWPLAIMLLVAGVMAAVGFVGAAYVAAQRGEGESAEIVATATAAPVDVLPIMNPLPTNTATASPTIQPTQPPSPTPSPTPQPTATPTPARVGVPSLVGLTQDEAVGTLATLGLRLGAVSYQNVQGVPAGVVVDQQPPKGAAIVPGSAIDLVISNDGSDTKKPPGKRKRERD